MQIPLLLDRSRPATLALQIVEQLRDAIVQGRIAAGARMPSSRRLAEQLDVSRNTVVRAYESLAIESYVETRPASGIFAADRPPDRVPRPVPTPAPTGVTGQPSMPMPYLPIRAQELVARSSSRIAFDFFPGRPSAGLFPLKTWRRLIQACLSHGGAVGLAQYSDPAGLAVLRTAIASHVAVARGIVADVNRVIVTGGVQEGINIASRLFLGEGTVAVIENPCYQGARFAFESCGAQVISVPVDAEGVVTDALPRPPASLIYVTPSHQYPTGHVLSLERRQALIAWARRAGCYILEDDYDNDFRYDGSPLPSIAALAPDCTIHLGTFSKSLGAGLRLGYLVVPEPIAQATRRAKALFNNGNSWLEQAALAEMIRSGSYAAHLSRIRIRYKDSRDALLLALRRQFGGGEISGAAAGLHILWQPPAGVPDAAVLEQVARRARVGIYSLAGGGAFDQTDSELARRGVILGYAALLPRQIEQGISRLSEAIDEALELPRADLALRFPQQPALRALGTHRASFVSEKPTESRSPMPVVANIYRYPIKGLSPQRVAEAFLQPGQAFPKDRLYALTRPRAQIHAEIAKWAKKGLFVMLMLDEALAQVTTDLDIDSLDFTIRQGNRQLLAVNLANERGRCEVEAFFERLVPTLNGRPKLVRAETGGHFMDKPDQVLSLINLATIRSLEEQWGFEIDPLRFRANIYIDGAEPWSEFGWVGRDIAIDDAILRVDRRNGRCGATNVNPVTGRRDLDLPGSLRTAFGHKDLGVYLITRKAGSVRAGSSVLVPRGPMAAHAAAPMPAPPPRSERRFMCRGCYYVYEEQSGLPQQNIPPGTAFGMIADSWRCPDCGTEKANFRPLVLRTA
jgi:GntR family transcriptional regulator / MocR family aminotransferase